MDIANLLESHRKHFIGLLNEEPLIGDVLVMEHAYDKATVKVLLDLHRTAAPIPQPITKDAAPAPRGGPKPGSKAARERALKAQETRKANAAKKKLEELKGQAAPQDQAPLSTATHLSRTGD